MALVEDRVQKYIDSPHSHEEIFRAYHTGDLSFEEMVGVVNRAFFTCECCKQLVHVFWSGRFRNVCERCCEKGE